jgi:hypothetical protein
LCRDQSSLLKYYNLRDYGTATWDGGDGECDHEAARKKTRFDYDMGPKQASSRGTDVKVYDKFCPACGAVRIDNQIGAEDSPQEYIQTMVGLFREIWRILRDDGTVWLNLGDSYYNYRPGSEAYNKQSFAKNRQDLPTVSSKRGTKLAGFKEKDLMMIPARVALALWEDGWYLRSDIIWCLSGGAIVYAKTQKGEGPSTLKDLVRLSPETVKLWNGQKWTQVKSWTQNARPDNPIEITLRSGERIGCTPNHVWPTQRGNVRAGELNLGDVIQTCKLPEPENPLNPELIPDEIGWFLGLYLAEGSRSSGCISIASHIKEDERFEKLQAMASKYGGTCRKHTYIGNSMSINLYSKVLDALIDTYIGGKIASDKYLKPTCWQRSDNFLRYLMAGYLEGDGHYDALNQRWRIRFSRNYALENSFRTLCARVGYFLRLKPAIAKGFGKEFPCFSGELRMSRTDHWNNKDDGEILNIGISRARQFWDIEVEDDPHLFALASGVLTHNSKPNPMPESVNDRPTKSHEYIYLLTKTPFYYYDAEAIREPHLPVTLERIKHSLHTTHPANIGVGIPPVATDVMGERFAHPGGRNKRSVWTVTTQSYSGSHFATFPEKLIEPCILAGSPTQVCSNCGTGWERILKPVREHGEVDVAFPKTQDLEPHNGQKRLHQRLKAARDAGEPHDDALGGNLTIGWRPGCLCNKDGIKLKTGDFEIVDCHPFQTYLRETNGIGNSRPVTLYEHREYVSQIEKHIEAGHDEIVQAMRQQLSPLEDFLRVKLNQAFALPPEIIKEWIEKGYLTAVKLPEPFETTEAVVFDPFFGLASRIVDRWILA